MHKVLLHAASAAFIFAGVPAMAQNAFANSENESTAVEQYAPINEQDAAMSLMDVNPNAPGRRPPGGPGHGPGNPGHPGNPPGHGPGHGPGHPGHPGWPPGHGGPGYPPPPPTQWIQLQCGSGGYETNFCGVNGYVLQARMVAQYSNAPCIANQTWGAQQNGIWVSRGCRGAFQVLVQW